MLVEQGDHLAANLRCGNVGIQVDTIQAYEIQHHMPGENLIDVANHCHRAYPAATRGAIIALLISHRKRRSAVCGWPH
jgi:hypothetical protein